MDSKSARGGLGLALLAYTWWGVVPLYWKRLAHVDPLEILAHRVLGALLVGLALLAWRSRLRPAWQLLSARRTGGALVGSTALIALNWGLFIWAVVRGRLAEASLGYFINPLCNALLGRFVLGERLSQAQGAAVVAAGAGVLWLTLSGEQFPWVALALAVTFSLYGLIRKQAPVGALEGFTVEAGLVAPFALGYLATRTPAVGAIVVANGTTRALLVGAGLVTAVPLVSFAEAARRLRYTTLGMVQFVAPSLQLACAVLLFGERMTPRFAVAFAAIGTGACLFAADALRRDRAPLAA